MAIIKSGGQPSYKSSTSQKPPQPACYKVPLGREPTGVGAASSGLAIHGCAMSKAKVTEPQVDETSPKSPWWTNIMSSSFWKTTAALVVIFLALGIIAKDWIVQNVNLPGSSSKPDKSSSDLDAVGNEVYGLKLPKDQTVTTKDRVVKIQAVSDNDVKWLVFSKSGVTYDIYSEHKLLYIFPNNVAEEIIIYAYTSINDKPSEPARSVITVTKEMTSPSDTGPAPAPDPIPTPKPEPKPEPPPLVINEGPPLSITFIAEGNLGLDVVLDSAPLRAAWRKRGDDIWDLRPDAKALANANLTQYIQRVLKAGGKLPVFIIQPKVPIGAESPVLAFGQVPKTELEMVQEINRALAKAKAN